VSTYAFPMRSREIQSRGVTTVGPANVGVLNGATATLHTMTVPQTLSIWLTGLFVTTELQNLPFDDDMEDFWVWIEGGNTIVWPYTEGEAAVYGTAARFNARGLLSRQTRGGVWIPVMLRLDPGTYNFNCENLSTVPVRASVALEITTESLLIDADPLKLDLTLEQAVTGVHHNPMGPIGTPFVQATAPGLDPQDGLYKGQVAPGVF